MMMMMMMMNDARSLGPGGSQTCQIFLCIPSLGNPESQTRPKFYSSSRFFTKLNRTPAKRVGKGSDALF